MATEFSKPLLNLKIRESRKIILRNNQRCGTLLNKEND